MWTPVIDLSRHNGSVDFRVMRAKGVKGLIFRITHGQRVDDRVLEYVKGALAAGYAKSDVVFYSFINPKRGTAAECAAATVAAIRSALGTTDTGLMLDMEWYRNEAPDAGQAPVRGQAYADYCDAFIDAARAAAPDLRFFGYTSQAFWGPEVGVAMKHALEVIVPRYPVYSADGYTKSPVPVDPTQWDEWAYAKAPSAVRAPEGMTAAGWQFSAGFNGMGKAYGCQSGDLDLNIVQAEAWARWTASAAPVPQPKPPAPKPPAPKPPAPKPQPKPPAPKPQAEPWAKRKYLIAPVQHPDVAVLQKALNKLAGAKLLVDGIMNPGKETELAVRDWQKFFGLHVDGEVGPQTWGMIYYVAALRKYVVE